MAEVTRVPLQPIEKGSLTKLWLGIALAVLVAAGIAWAMKPAGGIEVIAIEEGTGPSPTDNDVVLVDYTGKLDDGTVFDEAQRVPLPLDGMIPGFVEGLKKMKKGGKYTLKIPSKMGYGESGRGPIPPNADLTFEITLHDFMDGQEFQQRMQAMQQMMQQGAPGAPGGPGGPGGPPQPGQ
ncbi:MAG: FKBP-type peptidyl-prolyl cis-trans isomerase [Sphingomonadales bacterium]|nr:FKBP-type peptidyl-prolyl cis-trans isomerase [Sphingomonadales bacterium]MBD3773670.1 FKBP-type peptidyl-prolyl cis-trans isomerase [Paracoccaceae bacterium]